MTVLALAVRLARAGGRLRLVLVALGCGVGTLTLLIAFGVPATRPRLSMDEQRLAAVALVALAVPVTALLASVSRLAAGSRDRRLAALRQLGVSATATRLAAGVEATLQAAVGVALGAVAFVVLRVPVQSFDDAHRRWFAGRSLAPGVWGWLGATAGVLAVCLVVALLPSRAVTRTPLAVRRRATVARPRLWRLIPVVSGVVLLGYSVVRRASHLHGGAHGDGVVTFLIGVMLAGLGVPLATPLLVRLSGDVLVRVGRPAAVLAGRRLQQEPAGGARLVATLLTAVFFVVGARCVVTAFEQQPDVQDARRVATTGPQYLAIDRSGTEPASTAVLARAADRLDRVPGVRDTAVSASGAVVCGRAPGVRQAVVDQCAPFVVSACGRPAAGTDAPGCREHRLQWLVPAGTSAREIPAGHLTLAGQDAGGRWLSVPVPSHVTTVRQRDRGDLPIEAGQVMLRVPSDSPLLRTLRAGRVLPPELHVTADGGVGVQRRIAAAVRPLGLFVSAYDDASEWTTVQGYLDLVDAAAAGLFALALLALLVTGVDAAAGRRRDLAALARVGVPGRLGTAAQLTQVAVPAVFGSLAAAASGVLAGAAYLGLGGTAAATPWGSAVGFAMAASAGAVVVAALTGVGSGRLRTGWLRQE